MEDRKIKNASNFIKQCLKNNLINFRNEDYDDDVTRDNYGAEMESRDHDEA